MYGYSVKVIQKALDSKVDFRFSIIREKNNSTGKVRFTMEQKKKRKKGKIVTSLVILVVIVLAVLYLFTPFGFFNLKLEGEYQVKVTVNGQELTATMENNTSSMAFKRLLKRGSKTVNMRDYGGMEKVGMLWKGLPANNTQITTEPGDIILFMGSSLVVYYNRNSWNFTRMGHINDISQEELKKILGTGNVSMTFELLDE